jgi:hypothetical protein
MSLSKTLQDFERACQQAADEAKREQMALAARDFLIRTPVPQTVAEQINQQLAQESFSSTEAAPLPEAELELNRAACSQLEARLADFLPSLPHLSKSFDQGVVYVLLARARVICQKIDAWRQHDYWAPLFDFLKSANAETWQRWRWAFIAQQLARAEVRHGDFNLARLYAIYGLQHLAEIPDRRLYLDLCSRLENALAEGEGCFNVAFSLGHWVIRESLAAGHYLRAVGMGHNLGNQLLNAGQNDEALRVLENAKNVSEEWWSIRDMGYFQVNLLERLARAYFNCGEEKKAREYLELFGIYARRAREKTLYHLGKGYMALRAEQRQKAEQEFDAALQYAGGHDSSDAKSDFFNMWNAYVNLGLTCLRSGMPKHALAYFEKAAAHGEKLNGFLNAERRCQSLLLIAEARIQMDELPLAAAALEEVERLSQGLDAPRLRVQKLFTEALLHQKRNELDAAKAKLEQALQIGYEQGYDDAERQFDLIRQAIYN